MRPVRLAYLVTHPIQYQAPLLRLMAAEPDFDLTVFFGTDFSARAFTTGEFGREITWDVPLLEGLGSWTRRVTTSSPEAQRYFDQG